MCPLVLLLFYVSSNVYGYLLRPYGYPCSGVQFCPPSLPSGYPYITGKPYVYQPSYPPSYPSPSGPYPGVGPYNYGYPFGQQKDLTSCPFPYNSACLYGNGYLPGMSYGYLPIPSPNVIVVPQRCPTCPTTFFTSPIPSTTSSIWITTTSTIPTTTTTFTTTTTGIRAWYYCPGEINNIVVEGQVYSPGCLYNGARVTLICPVSQGLVRIGQIVPVGCLR